MRRVPQQHLNFNVRRERDRHALRRQALLLAGCLLLAVGFVVAARQQFAAVEHGYRSEELRRERERLLEEQRRLLLALEERASPAQLERAARQMGLQTPRASQIGRGAQNGATPTVGAEANAARRAEHGTARRVSTAERPPQSSAFVGSAAATSLRR